MFLFLNWKMYVHFGPPFFLSNKQNSSSVIHCSFVMPLKWYTFFFVFPVSRIQRAWRAYRDRKGRHTPRAPAAVTRARQCEADATPVDDGTEAVRRVTKLEHIHATEDEADRECENSETESAAGTQTMTLSTPEENQDRYAGVDSQSRTEGRSRSQQFLAVRVPVLRNLQDSECESVLSDYSELGGPLRELEKDIEVVDREELKNYDCPLPDSLLYAHVISDASLERQPGESDEEYSRRIRKLNFLSLAQEFAELKRINVDACPIDFHLSQGFYAKSTSSASSDKGSTSVSEAEPVLEAREWCPMERRGAAGLGRAGRGEGAVLMRDHSARRGLRGRREQEGSAKRNSHHGTPTREAHSPPGLDRRFSQPVEGDFEVFTMDSSVPAMNWELLEQQLQLAAEEERNRLEVSDSVSFLVTRQVLSCVFCVMSCRPLKAQKTSCVMSFVSCHVSYCVLMFAMCCVCLIFASLCLLVTTCCGKLLMWIRK